MSERQWERITYATVGSVAKVTMNRPEARNAMDFLMLDEIQEAFESADQDERVRVIVLAGAGKDFSAGHDPGPKARGARRPNMRASDMSLWDPDDPEWDQKLWFGEQQIFFRQALAMRDVSKPTIAQVHGRCIIGAVMNAAMCDLIVASDDASFRIANSEILTSPWDLGIRKAKELLWTSEPLDAQEAWRLGFVNKVVPRDHLDDEVMALAERIAKQAPFTTMLTKRSMNRMLDLMGQRDHFDYHFTSHQLWHRTRSGRQMLETAKAARESGSMKRLVQDPESSS